MSASKGPLLLLLFLLLVAHLGAGDQVYTLQRGETLYRISRRFNISVEMLQQYNGILDPSSIKTGTPIKIPSLYKVQKGETLYSIARRYGVAVETLMELNKIADSTKLRVGQELHIPQKTSPDSGIGGDSAMAASSPESSPSSGMERPELPVSPGSETPVTIAPPPARKEDDLQWPHPGRRESLEGKIKGIVIRGNPGDSIQSVSGGRVVWVGPYRGFGRVVFVESSSKYIYVYAGNEKTLVKVGEAIQPGSEIGRLGVNAHAGVPQLLFLVYHQGKPVDPYLAPRG